MTTAEAFNGVITIVGSGGLVSLIIAFLGFKKEAQKGRPDSDARPAMLAATNGAAQAKDVELLAQAISLNTAMMTRLVSAMEEAAERHERERDLRLIAAELRRESRGPRD